jgi:hypothetical protein
MRDEHTKFHAKRQFDMMRQLRDDADLPNAALRVGLLIVDRLRRKDSAKTGTRAGQARLSQEAIAEILAIDPRTVGRAILSLKEREHFDVRGTPWRGGRAHCNVYTPRLRTDAQGRFDFEEGPKTPVKMPGFKAAKTPTKMPGLSPELNTETPVDLSSKPRSKCPVSPSDSVWKTEKTEESFQERESGSRSLVKKLPRSRSGGAVIPEGPTPRMITYAAKEIGWSEQESRRQYLDMIAWYANEGKEIRSPEGAWRFWIKRELEFQQRKRQLIAAEPNTYLVLTIEHAGVEYSVMPIRGGRMYQRSWGGRWSGRSWRE